jgi:hypothetical protein
MPKPKRKDFGFRLTIVILAWLLLLLTVTGDVAQAIRATDIVEKVFYRPWVLSLSSSCSIRRSLSDGRGGSSRTRFRRPQARGSQVRRPRWPCKRQQRSGPGKPRRNNR